MNSEQHHVTPNPRGSGEARGTAAIIRRLRAWWERQQTAQRLLAADAGERGRMARELGMGPPDVGRLTASPRSGETLLPAMMGRFHIDEAGLGLSASGALRDMRRVCATCPSTRRCARALAAETPAEECRGFCPNGETLVALAARGVSHQPKGR